MVLSIIIILFIGVIAFFHFVQGFFSATLSAMITILAAVTAVSYHENVVNLLLKGKMADLAHGMVLCMIFAVVYITLRVIFDMAIPGNVRMPSTVDKVGAAVMGVVSGIFATGIFAIAVQMLPFDPNISFMGAQRYATRDNPLLQLPRKGQSSEDTKISEQMDDNALTPDKQKGLLLPVDDWVLDTVYHLSDGGSLAGDRSLASIHPDYLQELFGERLGIQTGGRRVALYSAANQTIDIKGVYSLPSLPAKDGEIKELRPAAYEALIKLDKDGNGVVKPTADQRILIVRVKINSGATDDEDQIFRFSCGSIRIVGKTQNGYKDFHPIGTLEGKMVLLNNPDDFLFVKAGNAFDAVFLVDQSLLTASSKTSNTLVGGTFITIKRFANLDLSGQEVMESVPADGEVQVLRQQVLADKLKLPPPAAAGTTADNTPPPAPVTPTPVAPTPAPTPTPTQDTPTPPQTVPGKEIAASLKATAGTDIMVTGFRGIGVNTADATAADAAVAGGTISFGKAGITLAKIDPTADLAKLGEGTSSQTQFSVPADRVAVQVTMRPNTPSWEWMAQIGTTKLLDSNGNGYAPNGCYALAKGAAASGLFLRFDAEHTNFSVTSPDGALDGDVYYVFFIPKDTDVKSFTMAGKTQDLDTPLHVQ